MRTIIFLATLFLGVVLLTPRRVEANPAPNATRFQLTGSGSLYHFETVTAGTKPFVSKLSISQISLCIAGTGDGCNSTNLDINGGGKAYLYIIDGNDTSIFISTADDCSLTTELDGLVGGTGTFMFAGEHLKSHTKVQVQGTVSFDKTQFPSFVPLGIKKASIMAVSEPLEHYAIGTFATVGAGVRVVCE